MTTTAARLRVLWAFTRPHTIIGTVLAVCAMYLLAAHAAGRGSLALWALVLTVSIAVNIYVVGLNQLTDVDIDRISKPHLPLAAGHMGRGAAVAVVAATGSLALLLAGLQGRYLFAAIASVAAIGTCYSLPPLRLKRFPAPAAASIVLARAVVANIGVYLACVTALGGAALLPASVVLLVGFMAGFAAVIAVMKDIPDVDGDRRHRISTVALRLGARRTTLLCRVLLSACYAAVISAGVLGVPGVHTGLLVSTHTAALVAVWAVGVDPAEHGSVVRYYMFVWKLFYLEFVIFTAACLA